MLNCLFVCAAICRHSICKLQVQQPTWLFSKPGLACSASWSSSTLCGAYSHKADCIGQQTVQSALCRYAQHSAKQLVRPEFHYPHHYGIIMIDEDSGVVSASNINGTDGFKLTKAPCDYCCCPFCFMAKEIQSTFTLLQYGMLVRSRHRLFRWP